MRCTTTSPARRRCSASSACPTAARELGLPVVLRWEGEAGKDREAVWVQSGEQTRIGLWKPAAGISGARPGAHVHFALTVAEKDYDAIVAQIRAHSVHVDEVYFGDDPKAPGMRSAYMEDPDGHRVEIWTRDIATQIQAGPPHPVSAGHQEIE